MFESLASLFRRRRISDATPGSRKFGSDWLKSLKSQYEAFKLARRTRPRENHQPYAYSGDAAILTSHDLMGRRVRDAVRNEPQAKRIVNRLTDLVVGTGIQTFSWPFLPNEMLQIVTELESLDSGTLGPRLSFAMEADDLFEEWGSDPKQVDVEGRFDWMGLQRELMRENTQTGNGLLVRVFKRDYKLVPLSFQLIEREQLDLSQDRPANPNANDPSDRNKIVGGIEMTIDNVVVAYHVFLDHPHEFFGIVGSSLQGAGAGARLGLRPVRIPAERVIDLATYHRPSASLGTSAMDAAGTSMHDRDGYISSEMMTADAESRQLLVAHLNDAEKYGAVGMDDDIDDEDDFGNRQFNIGRSPLASVVGVDERIELVQPSRPNRNAPPFIALQDRDTASSVDLSYYDLTGDYANANFTSTRGAKIDQEVSIACKQLWFACQVCKPVRQQFDMLAAAHGLYKTVDAETYLSNLRTYQRFDVIGNGRELLDPFKEGAARTERLRTGVSSFKEESARRGKHWIRELLQVALERRVMKILGVTLDLGDGSGSESSSGDVGVEEDNNPVTESSAANMEWDHG